MASNDLQAKADLENRRLETQHEVWKYAFRNQLVFAPLELTGAACVLDSAGANGCWLEDYQSTLSPSVREHSQSRFVSADINQMMLPKKSQRSGNIEYLRHSFLDTWPGHLHSTFDLVHQRLAIAASGKVPIVETIQRFAALLKPGSGWLQLVELDTSPDSSLAAKYRAAEDFKHLLHTVSTTTGVRAYFANGLAQDLRDAGLLEVQEKRIQVPWGRAIQGNEELFQQSLAFPGLPFFAETFCAIARKMDLADERYHQLPERLEKQLLETGVVLNAVVVWGRRAA